MNDSVPDDFFLTPLDPEDDFGLSDIYPFVQGCKHQPRLESQTINRFMFVHCSRCGGQSPRFSRAKKARRWWTVHFPDAAKFWDVQSEDVMELDE